MEEHEQERSKFLQSMFYKYVDLHIAVHEKSGEVSMYGIKWLWAWLTSKVTQILINSVL